jgi:hypothetical protein
MTLAWSEMNGRASRHPLLRFDALEIISFIGRDDCHIKASFFYLNNYDEEESNKEK